MAGFDALYALMQQRMSISGKSQSTLKNYSHHVAKIKSLPTIRARFPGLVVTPMRKGILKDE